MWAITGRERAQGISPQARREIKNLCCTLFLINPRHSSPSEKQTNARALLGRIYRVVLWHAKLVLRWLRIPPLAKCFDGFFHTPKREFCKFFDCRIGGSMVELSAEKILKIRLVCVFFRTIIHNSLIMDHLSKRVNTDQQILRVKNEPMVLIVRGHISRTNLKCSPYYEEELIQTTRLS